MDGQLRIETLYAFVCVDEDGTEGVPAFSDGKSILPMMGADLAKVEYLRPLAQRVANDGLKVTLVHFTNRVEIEILTSNVAVPNTQMKESL